MEALMRKLYKLPILLLSTSVIMASSMGNLKLTTSVSLDEMKQYLLDSNIPSLYLESTSSEQIEHLYNDLYNQPFECGESTVLTLTETTNVEARGTIPDEDMIFMITPIYMYTDYTTKQIEHVYITTAYRWLNIPFYLKQDAVIVNWDSNIFTLEENSFYQYNYAETDAIEGLSYKLESYNAANITLSALAYNVQLGRIVDDTFSYPPTKLYGSSNFNLIPAHNPTYYAPNHSVTSVTAQYRHNRNPFIGCIGFNIQGVFISFNTSVFTDTVADSANIEYSTSI